MTIIVKEPGKSPEKREIECELKPMQDIVGGYLETVLIMPGILLVCNEEGKLLHLPINFLTNHDAFVGTVFFVSYDGENFAGLTDEQCQAVLEWYEENTTL